MKTGLNLAALFDMQRKLDERIEQEHPRKPGEDRLAKKILALLVELGELANEARFFKFWSNDQKPRMKKEVFCTVCDGTGTPLGIPEESGVDCYQCDGAGVYFINPLLEEYVDCLHFILSIGLEKGYDKYPLNSVFENHIRQENITQQFIGLIASSPSVTSYAGYLLTLQLFIGLGEMLGFTWDEIEEEYMKKNAENHRRQKVGY